MIHFEMHCFICIINECCSRQSTMLLFFIKLLVIGCGNGKYSIVITIDYFMIVYLKLCKGKFYSLRHGLKV